MTAENTSSEPGSEFWHGTGGHVRRFRVAGGDPPSAAGRAVAARERRPGIWLRVAITVPICPASPHRRRICSGRFMSGL